MVSNIELFEDGLKIQNNPAYLGSSFLYPKKESKSLSSKKLSEAKSLRAQSALWRIRAGNNLLPRETCCFQYMHGGRHLEIFQN